VNILRTSPRLSPRLSLKQKCCSMSLLALNELFQRYTCKRSTQNTGRGQTYRPGQILLCTTLNLLQQDSQADSKDSYVTLHLLVLPQARSVHRHVSQRKLLLCSQRCSRHLLQPQTSQKSASCHDICIARPSYPLHQQSVAKLEVRMHMRETFLEGRDAAGEDSGHCHATGCNIPIPLQGPDAHTAATAGG